MYENLWRKKTKNMFTFHHTLFEDGYDQYDVIAHVVRDPPWYIFWKSPFKETFLRNRITKRWYRVGENICLPTYEGIGLELEKAYLDEKIANHLLLE